MLTFGLLFDGVALLAILSVMARTPMFDQWHRVAALVVGLLAVSVGCLVAGLSGLVALPVGLVVVYQGCQRLIGLTARGALVATTAFTAYRIVSTLALDLLVS